MKSIFEIREKETHEVIGIITVTGNIGDKRFRDTMNDVLDIMNDWGLVDAPSDSSTSKSYINKKKKTIRKVK